MSVLVEHQGAPDRTLAQRFKNLDRANEARLRMADVKREMASGVLSFQAALLDDRAQGMEIGAVLCSLPRWGVVKTRKLLGRLLVGEHRRVRDLTERQSSRLLAEIGKERRP